MTKEDIELTVLTTMAEATVSSAEKHQLMTKVESARYNELMRLERNKQVLLRMMLYVLVGILGITALQPLVPLLTSLPPKHPVASTTLSTNKPWWVLWNMPAKTPPTKYSP